MIKPENYDNGENDLLLDRYNSKDPMEQLMAEPYAE